MILITRYEMAPRLDISLRTLDRRIAKRRIPFIKDGHLVKFDPEMVEKHYRDNNSVNPRLR